MIELTSRPYTRWWWFSGEILREDIRFQVKWLKENGFGGVEIAWVYPLPYSRPGPVWLSEDWSSLVEYTKQICSEFGLGCDFTFGTLWPFGGSIVPEKDASKTYDGISSQRITRSWEEPHAPPGFVLNHLDRTALERYSEKIGAAIIKALRSNRSALFCDSWEVTTEKLWTEGFGATFETTFGYDVEHFMNHLDDNPDIRYDYRRLIAQYVLEEFYQPLTQICHRLGAISRVQCHGAPVDLLAAYAAADIPETEVILFDPHFASFAASAAALTGKPYVSCETFTCLYGWKPRPGPAPYLKAESIADMRLLVDAVFAQGVNHIIWHGMPFNPPGGSNEFYATVHVGPDSGFAHEIPEFNAYMARISSLMRFGKPWTDVAVYLPLEDNWMKNRLPENLHRPSAEYYWELHYQRMPEALAGYQPVWVTAPFLSAAVVTSRGLRIGACTFQCLYVDVHYMDIAGLVPLLRLARHGLAICMIRRPVQPGRRKSDSYEQMLDELTKLPNVYTNMKDLPIPPPLVAGQYIPDFRCRIDSNECIIFFANPASKDLIYPLQYKQAEHLSRHVIDLEITVFGKTVKCQIDFQSGQSAVIRVRRNSDKSIDVVVTSSSTETGS